MNRAVRAVLIVVVLVVLVTVGRHFIHANTPTTTTTTTSTSTTTSTPSSTSSPTTSTTTRASLTTCRGSQFTGVNVGSEGAAGTGYDTMTLTKVSSGSCVVDSYPLVTLQEAKGVVESNYKTTDSTNFPAPANAGVTARTITVGQKISVQIRYSDVPVGTEACPEVVQVNLQFVPGDTSVPVVFPFPISPCVGEGISVSPFYAS